MWVHSCSVPNYCKEKNLCHGTLLQQNIVYKRCMFYYLKPFCSLKMHIIWHCLAVHCRTRHRDARMQLTVWCRNYQSPTLLCKGARETYKCTLIVGSLAIWIIMHPTHFISKCILFALEHNYFQLMDTFYLQKKKDTAIPSPIIEKELTIQSVPKTLMEFHDRPPLWRANYCSGPHFVEKGYDQQLIDLA